MMTAEQATTAWKSKKTGEWEHNMLISIIESIEHFVAETGEETFRREVAGRMGYLLERLQTHWGHEERSPLYKKFPQQYPQYREELELRLGEHKLFSKRIQEVTYDAGQPGDSTELRGRCSELMQAIRAHEESEHRIIRELVESRDS